VSVLARLVSAVREAAADRLYRTLADAAETVDAELPGRLRRLLEVPAGARVSELERLRRAPTRTSGPAMEKALDRVAELAGLGVRAADVSVVPANRLATLARYGLTSRAPTLKALAEPRRTATLLAAVRLLETAAVDDALDLFALLMTTRLLNPARRASARDRLAELPRLEKASLTLARVGRVLLDALAPAVDSDPVDVAAAWAALQRAASRDQVADAVAVVEQLVPDDAAGEAAMRAELTRRYGTVRPFLLLLSEALPLAATRAGRPILNAVQGLPELVGRRRIRPDEIDAGLVAPMWRRAVFANPDLPAGIVDRDAYVLCVLEQLHRALRRRDVFAFPSDRWADPRAQLLTGDAWEQIRGEVLTGLGLSDPVETHLGALVRSLDAAWRQTADRLAEAGDDAPVRVVPAADGRVRLSVERLEAVGEPASLSELRTTVAAMLPRVDLPDLLLEVHAWTGFLDAYTHVGQAGTRMENLPISIAALLIAEACNVGLTPVTKPAEPALTRDRLSHVDQNYLRADTHAAANAALVDAQAQIPVARA
jgi:hypothetical protein